MENLYSALAPFYDALNGEIDYGAWADFLEESFARLRPAGVHTVLDLGCGTGRMTLELARRGYDMIGVDGSAEMLAVAREKAEQEGLSGSILFLQQDITEFELYGTVDAVVCCLDTVNHITDRAALGRCFRWVHNYLNPGGLFLFDVNTPYKFEHIYGDRAYLLEDGHAFCAWQNYYRKRSGLCDFYISLFVRGEDGRYTRSEHLQRERCYPLPTLRRMLTESRLLPASVSGGLDFAEPGADCPRFYLAAVAEKENT